MVTIIFYNNIYSITIVQLNLHITIRGLKAMNTSLKLYESSLVHEAADNFERFVGFSKIEILSRKNGTSFGFVYFKYIFYRIRAGCCRSSVRRCANPVKAK